MTEVDPHAVRQAFRLALERALANIAVAEAPEDWSPRAGFRNLLRASNQGLLADATDDAIRDALSDLHDETSAIAEGATRDAISDGALSPRSNCKVEYREQSEVEAAATAWRVGREAIAEVTKVSKCTENEIARDGQVSPDTYLAAYLTTYKKAFETGIRAAVQAAYSAIYRPKYAAERDVAASQVIQRACARALSQDVASEALYARTVAMDIATKTVAPAAHSIAIKAADEIARSMLNRTVFSTYDRSSPSEVATDACKLLASAGVSHYWVRPRDVLVLKAPKLRTENGELHCADGPAVSWAEGEKYYFWHGIEVDRALIEDPDSVDVVSVLSWPNQEMRRVALEILGWERVLSRVGAREVQRDRFGTLLETDVLKDDYVSGGLSDNEDFDNHYAIGDSFRLAPARFVRVRCPSTGRQYVLRVPPYTSTAMQGVAWTFRMTPAEYRLTAET